MVRTPPSLRLTLASLVLLLLSAALLTAASPSTTITLNGVPVTLRVAPVVVGNEWLVWLEDLGQTGVVRARWDAKTRVGTLSAGTTALELRHGSRELVVRATQPDGKVKSEKRVLPVAPSLSEGRLLVPLEPVCRALGLAVSRAPRVPVEARGLAAEDHPHPRATGAIVGEVTYHQRPVAGIVLRLVRGANSTFVKERRAVSDPEGRYRFIGVPAGRYRVYAYTGDNREYFNRETEVVEVRDSLVKAPRIAVGRLLVPLAPPAGAKVRAVSAVAVRWTACPEASEYTLTLVDAQTAAQVVREHLAAAEVTLPGRTFTRGHSYEIRVRALASDGSFLGATPGAGAAPWTVTAE